MMKLLPVACVLFGWLHASALAPDSEIVYRNEQLALTFAAPAQGAGLAQIRNLAAGHDFWSASSDKPLLWNICFSKVGTNDTQHQWVDNRNAAACRAEMQDGKLVITWDKLAIDTIKDAFSVRLTVAWDEQGAANLWLEPTLHTTEYSFRDLLFPCREQVLDPATEEVLFPRGNIGSRLVDYPISGTYPGCESQLQFFGWFKKEAPGGIYRCDD